MRLHALPIFLGTLCVLAIAYRFYSAFIAALGGTPVFASAAVLLAALGTAAAALLVLLLMARAVLARR